MTDFKAKMHQIRFRLGLRPRPRWGSLQRSPRPPSWIWGRSAAGAGLGKRRERGGEGREGEVEGREREGPKLLLNQGPSEPYYATGCCVSYRVGPCSRSKNLRLSGVPSNSFKFPRYTTLDSVCIIFTFNMSKTLLDHHTDWFQT